MSRRRALQQGYSLIEALIVVVISLTVMIIAYQMLEAGMRSTMRLESRNDLTTMAQKPINALQNAVYQSRTIFVNDAVGQAYYARINTALAAAGAAAPAPDTLLPLTSNSLGPDTGTGSSRETGNVLLFARQLPPILVDYDHDNDSGTAQVKFPVDRYRFEIFYLTRDTARPFSTSTYAVDLIRARTIDFADYFQLSPLIDNSVGTPAFTLAQRQQITAGMSANGLTRAWNPQTGLLPTNSFYTITMSGSNAGRMALQTNPTLNIKSTSSMIQNLRGGAISGRIVYSVGFRRSFTDPWDSMQNIRHPIPFLAAPDPSFPNFPGGLEIKVVGTGNAERVVARLVVMSNHSVTTFDAQSAMVIAARGMS